MSFDNAVREVAQMTFFNNPHASFRPVTTASMPTG